MALLGRGVVAIWNGINNAAETEFVRWHVREHIPERVGLPGFLRGRRYVSHDGNPKYFNFYETETVATLNSAAYRERLNDPTPWTRNVVSEFRDTSRTICEVAASEGIGEGAWIETIRFSLPGDQAGFQRQLLGSIVPAVKDCDGIVGVHLLQGTNPANGSAKTTESTLRSKPDQVAAWILLVESVELDTLAAVRTNQLSNESVQAAAGSSSIQRGIYRLQFALTKTEIANLVATMTMVTPLAFLL